MARPRAITDEVEKRLLEALGVGAPIRIACGYAGIDPATYHRECERNSEFRDKAIRARHQAAIRNLALIQKAAPEDWRAAAKFLELTFPEEFSRQRLEVSGPGGSPLTVAHAEVSPELVAGALRILGEGGGGAAPESGAEPVHPPQPD